MDEPAVELRLELEWELWVVENLLAGATVKELAEALATQGIEAAVALARVREIAEAPRLRRLRTRVGRALIAEQHLAVRRIVAGATALEVRPTLDRASFHARHWIPSRPVLLTEAMQDVPAVRTWNLAFFRDRFGELEVDVNVSRDRARAKSMTEAASERMRLADFIDEAQTTQGNARYLVSRNGLLARPELRALEADLAPLPPMLEPPRLPAGVSLWLGPAGTFSPAHFDPHGVLLVQVEGRKQVRIVSPDQLALLEDMDGYYARLDLDDPALRTHPDFDPAAILSTVLEPGQALFIPVGWFHEVTALDPSLTLSFLSFPWPNHFHWLGHHRAAATGRSQPTPSRPSAAHEE